MSIFSVPVVRLASIHSTKVPATVPVTFEGEHVADATFDGDDSYLFNLFRGNLEQGLTSGQLSVRAVFDDAPGDDTGKLTRTYKEVVILPTGHL
jgi:hypothetical protein